MKLTLRLAAFGSTGVLREVSLRPIVSVVPHARMAAAAVRSKGNRDRISRAIRRLVEQAVGNETTEGADTQ